MTNQPTADTAHRNRMNHHISLSDPATERADANGIEVSDGYVSLKWRYSYDIRLNQIKTQSDLLKWYVHLSQKTWMTANRMNLFISAVMDVKGWDKYGIR